MYNAVRDNRIQDCENFPIAQQEFCHAQYQTTYDEYRRELEELRVEQW